MDRDLARLHAEYHPRRDIRLQPMEMQALIDADIGCTAAARLLMQMQAALVLFIEKRERLLCHALRAVDTGDKSCG
jgi:hypothetical protein